MKTDILVIGGGASGLMAAYSAAKSLVDAGSDAQVTVLEKMPRPGRKIMITGKGRCNFTNVKDWNGFSGHIRSNAGFIKAAFYNLNPEKLVAFFEEYGMQSVVERGDRAFPASYHASDVVDTLVSACHSLGVKIICEAEVTAITPGKAFQIALSDGSTYVCRKLVIATGGLSYPTTARIWPSWNPSASSSPPARNSRTFISPSRNTLRSLARTADAGVSRSAPCWARLKPRCSWALPPSAERTA